MNELKRMKKQEKGQAKVHRRAQNSQRLSESRKESEDVTKTASKNLPPADSPYMKSGNRTNAAG